MEKQPPAKNYAGKTAVAVFVLGLLFLIAAAVFLAKKAIICTWVGIVVGFGLVLLAHWIVDNYEKIDAYLEGCLGKRERI